MPSSSANQPNSEVGASKGGVSVDTETEIICKTYYINGMATTQLTITGNLNIGQALDNFMF